jgi:hypothetical protein
MSITINTTQITTVRSVKRFAEELRENGIIFHPDDSFLDYINFVSEEPTFTRAEAVRLDILMDECFRVCENKKKDIYTVMCWTEDWN